MGVISFLGVGPSSGCARLQRHVRLYFLFFLRALLHGNEFSPFRARFHFVFCFHELSSMVALLGSPFSLLAYLNILSLSAYHSGSLDEEGKFYAHNFFP
jgi:hypothetical protein